MNFKRAIKLLKKGYAVTHLSMNAGCYVEYSELNNTYTISGDNGDMVDFAVMDGVVFFEKYCKPQFDSHWSIHLVKDSSRANS